MNHLSGCCALLFIYGENSIYYYICSNLLVLFITFSSFSIPFVGALEPRRIVQENVIATNIYSLSKENLTKKACFGAI